MHNSKEVEREEVFYKRGKKSSLQSCNIFAFKASTNQPTIPEPGSFLLKKEEIIVNLISFYGE